MFNRYRYRGRHRAPSTTGRAVARAAVVAAAGVAPVALAELPASADPVLDPIVQCESGGDPTAQNASSSASGLYQMVDGTWKAYGGSTAHARQASVAEQTAVAQRLLADEGTSPWNASRSCWAGHVSTARPAVRAPAGVRTPAPAASSRQQAVRGAAGGSYVVKRGDSLSAIAASHGRAWRALWLSNRAVISNPGLIFPGQRLAL